MEKTGNREALLAGARTCLAERGWAHTTVRDIASAAGVSHAAIGYHFGSREALLTQALVASVDELAERLGEHDGADALRFSRALHESFRTDRALWLTQLEAVVQAARSEEVREHLAQGQRNARSRLGGSTSLALVTGLAVQAIVEPDVEPTDADLEQLAALVGAREEPAVRTG